MIGSKCEMVLGEGMPRALNIISDLARPFDFAHLSISSNDVILDVIPMSADALLWCTFKVRCASGIGKQQLELQITQSTLH